MCHMLLVVTITSISPIVFDLGVCLLWEITLALFHLTLVFIHSPVARTFFCAQFVRAHPHIVMRVHVHSWRQTTSRPFPKSAGHAHFRTSNEKFGYLTKSALNTGNQPQKFDRMFIDDQDLNEIFDFSKNTQENTGLFGVPTKLEASVSHVSHGKFPLQEESQDSVHRETNCLTEREREERGGSVISVSESM